MKSLFRTSHKLTAIFALFLHIALLLIENSHSIPQNVPIFSCAASTTDDSHLWRSFQLDYADGSQLLGYIANDEVQLGDFSAKATFGVIMESSGQWSTSGIMGLAFPSAGDPELGGSVIDALADPNRALSPNSLLSHKIFAMIFSNSSSQHGQLQLGGYDPSSVLYEPRYSYVPRFPFNGEAQLFAWAMKVSSIKIGPNLGSPEASMASTDAVELLQFKNPTNTNMNTYSGLVDSGTSCLMLPDGEDVLLSTSAFSIAVQWLTARYGIRTGGGGFNFAQLLNDNPVISFSTSSYNYSMPAKDWIIYPGGSPQLCIGSGQLTGGNMLLFGDVLFRSHVIIHDASDAQNPRLGIAVRNPSFDFNSVAVSRASSSSSSSVKALPLTKKWTNPTVHMYSHLHSSSNQDLISQIDTAAGLVSPRNSHRYEHLATPYTPAAAAAAQASTNFASKIARLPVTDLNDLEYTTVISIGQPRQRDLIVSVDTGSACLAVFSENCPSSAFSTLSSPPWKFTVVFALAVFLIGIFM